MIWSPQQERALASVAAWKRSRDKPYFLLAGYAGTGKSTLAKHLAEGVSRVVYACYTGKAAHVLRKQGLPARTIHSLIYTPRDKCDEKLRKAQRELEDLLVSEAAAPDEGARSEIRARQEVVKKTIVGERENLRRPDFFLNTASDLGETDLLVLDEYSMVDERTGRDLLSFGVPILALGDPGQLPPVLGQRFFREDPDVMLTEIHRQARDNPIIRMSADVRAGVPLRPGQYGSSRVVRMRDVPKADLGDLVDGGDQVLVGTNATRCQYNRAIRAKRGFRGDYPTKGEKVVCLRNNHQLGLLNGQVWDVVSSKMQKNFVRMCLEDDDGTDVVCHAHPDTFAGGEVDVTVRNAACEFDYGYALTVHKAQGSQWGKVVLVDEWRFKDRDKWLYTGVTRASESVTVLV
jgi:exodeoxyribonuclease-5